MFFLHLKRLTALLATATREIQMGWGVELFEIGASLQLFTLSSSCLESLGHQIDCVTHL